MIDILRNIVKYSDNPGYLGNCIRQIIGGQSEEFCLQEVAVYEDNESLCLSVRQAINMDRIINIIILINRNNFRQ